MSPALDPSNRTMSSASTSLDQTAIKPSANEQRVQQGKQPITHEPDPNAKREDIAKGNGKADGDGGQQKKAVGQQKRGGFWVVRGGPYVELC